MKPGNITIWLTAIRPKTLWAAFAPVAIGGAMAVEAGNFHFFSAFLALIGAVCIQVGTNFYNDLADFEKGADTNDRKGPTRVTQAGWVSPKTMKRATFFVFGLAVLSGMYLMWRGGWPVIVIGVLSIVSGIMYTAGKYSLAYIGLGDLFVLIFFGPVAVGGTYYVQTLEINTSVLIAGIAPGLLAVAILLVNNIRDREEDRQAEKKTIVVRFGRSFGIACYGICILGAALIPMVLLYMGTANMWVLLTSCIVIPGWVYLNKIRNTPSNSSLNPLLGSTAQLLLIYSVVFSVTWNL